MPHRLPQAALSTGSARHQQSCSDLDLSIPSMPTTAVPSLSLGRVSALPVIAYSYRCPLTQRRSLRPSFDHWPSSECSTVRSPHTTNPLPQARLQHTSHLHMVLAEMPVLPAELPARVAARPSKHTRAARGDSKGPPAHLRAPRTPLRYNTCGAPDASLRTIFTHSIPVQNVTGSNTHRMTRTPCYGLPAINMRRAGLRAACHLHVKNT